MTGLLRILGIFIVSVGMNLAVVADADARRLGGGRNLGNQPSSAQRAAPPPRSPAQQAAAGQNQQARQQLAQRGGLLGMLGGLAIGGLLGALFFGGAFENLNLLDIVLFGGIAFLLYRLFAARRRAGTRAQAAGTGAGTSFVADEPRSGSTLAPPALALDGSPHPAREPAPRPAGFDEPAFIAGARRAFERLQEGWNRGDLSEIRALTSDVMFAQLQDQMREPDADTFVQVMELDARLLDARERNGVQEATVRFDAVLRESESERPAQAREIWHFTRTTGARTPTWYLDGIEQMRD